MKALTEGVIAGSVLARQVFLRMGKEDIVITWWLPHNVLKIAARVDAFRCMEPSHIQCILFDDGLGGVAEFAEDYRWHDKFTVSPCKRIVRVETLAEVSHDGGRDIACLTDITARTF